MATQLKYTFFFLIKTILSFNKKYNLHVLYSLNDLVSQHFVFTSIVITDIIYLILVLLNYILVFSI